MTRREFRNAQILASKRKYWDIYLAKNRVFAKKSRATMKADVVKSLGGKCVHCGFTDIRALQVDHINGNGIQSRKAMGNNQWALYKSIIVDGSQGKYQLLCANCNWIKRFVRGEHRAFKPNHKSQSPL